MYFTFVHRKIHSEFPSKVLDLKKTKPKTYETKILREIRVN